MCLHHVLIVYNESYQMLRYSKIRSRRDLTQMPMGTRDNRKQLTDLSWFWWRGQNWPRYSVPHHLKSITIWGNGTERWRGEQWMSVNGLQFESVIWKMEILYNSGYKKDKKDFKGGLRHTVWLKLYRDKWTCQWLQKKNIC